MVLIGIIAGILRGANLRHRKKTHSIGEKNMINTVNSAAVRFSHFADTPSTEAKAPAPVPVPVPTITQSTIAPAVPPVPVTPPAAAEEGIFSKIFCTWPKAAANWVWGALVSVFHVMTCYCFKAEEKKAEEKKAEEKHVVPPAPATK